MDELLVGVLLYGIAEDYFEEAIDSESAILFANMNDWHPLDLERTSKVILDGFDPCKLAESGVTFTDSDIEYLKNTCIPETMQKRLEEFNVKIETRIKNGKLWIRSR